MAVKTLNTPAIEIGERAELRYNDDKNKKRPFGLNFSFRSKRSKEHRADQQKRTEQNRQARAAWNNDFKSTAASFPQLVKA